MNGRKTAALILDIAILILIGALIMYIFLSVERRILRRALIVALLLAAAVLIVYERGGKRPPRIEQSPKARVIELLGEREKAIRMWDLTGKAGFVIGKSTPEMPVDIDLGDTAYRAFIDESHAVINYTISGWWVEDVSVRNGTSILRKGEKLLLARGAPAQIYPGDIIVLAENTRLAVR